MMSADRPATRLATRLAFFVAGFGIACWPQEVDAATVTHAAVWAPPDGFFTRFPNLRTVFVMGAGVDKLLQRKDVPQDVTLIRLTDAGMAQQMTEYCLYGVLHYQRQIDRYAQQQRNRQAELHGIERRRGAGKDAKGQVDCQHRHHQRQCQ